MRHEKGDEHDVESDVELRATFDDELQMPTTRRRLVRCAKASIMIGERGRRQGVSMSSEGALIISERGMSGGVQKKQSAMPTSSVGATWLAPREHL